jgi:hypothetical protein
MSLIPRWRYMTYEAKALTKRTAVSALVVLLVFRASLMRWRQLVCCRKALSGLEVGCPQA